MESTQEPEAPVQADQEDLSIGALGCKQSDLAACGVDISTFSMKDKVPNLELTWEQMGILEIDIPAGVQRLQQLKTDPKYGGLPMFFMLVGDTRYVMRGTTRLEWNQFTGQMMADMPKKREELAEQGMDVSQVDLKMKAMLEEKVVAKFAVMPTFTHEEVIRMAPGDVTQLYDSWMMAVGFQEPPPAIKL